MNDGGPAFPWASDERSLSGQSGSGMTLRDYFAGKAIGLFAIEKEDLQKLNAGIRPDHKIAAKFCYDLADAMIAERERYLK